MSNHPPKNLQATLWSVDTNNLDIQDDKNYIIHQLFAYGDIPQWRWLFKAYPFKSIVNVFLSKPAKIYRPETFNFVKNILLNLKNKNLVKENYVKYPPRMIKSKSALIFEKLDAAKKMLQHKSNL